MGFVLGFLPWILYWILVGNIDFRLAICIALAVAVAAQVITRVRKQPWRSLDVGSLVIFVLLAIISFVVDDAVLEQWLQPLSNLGLFLVALVGILIGRPFVREYAAATVDAETARGDGFRYITTGMTWLWVGAFGLMTIISAIPPLVDGSASNQDEGSLLSILCYWVLPYVLLGLAGLVSGVFPPWFEKRSAMIDKREADETPQVAALGPEPADTSEGPLDVSLAHESAHDEPFPLVVTGAPPGSTVQVSATGPDLFGGSWRSAASFATPPSGAVDLAAAAPVSGDWAQADPGAPLWAMRFATPDKTPDLFVPPVDAWPVTVDVEVAGVGRIQRTVHRRGTTAAVVPEPVEIDGRPGLLVRPARPAPPSGWPAVVCFGGSEGGYESQAGHAVMLAGHGYLALAACWLPAPESVKGIASVPLERFLAPVGVLNGRPDVDATRIAAMAISRGAEGLLAAAVRAAPAPYARLALISPSSVTWQAVGPDGSIPDTPSWTYEGEPVPWLPMPTGAIMPQLIRNAWQIGRDTAAHRPTLLRLRPSYEAGLQARSTQTVDAAIAAERAAGPLLVITGGDDQLWPSQAMANELLARRSAAGDDHLHLPEAGHLIRLGQLPTDAQWTGGIALGGTRTGQAQAQSEATAKVLDFLAGMTA